MKIRNGFVSNSSSTSFYIDGSGRAIIGNYDQSNNPYPNTGYLGVNLTDPQDLVHIYGLDNIPDDTNTNTTDNRKYTI